MRALLVAFAFLLGSVSVLAEEKPIAPNIHVERITQDDIAVLYKQINLAIKLSFDREQQCAEADLELICCQNSEMIFRMVKDYRKVGWLVEEHIIQSTGKKIYIFSFQKKE